MRATINNSENDDSPTKMKSLLRCRCATKHTRGMQVTSTEYKQHQENLCLLYFTIQTEEPDQENFTGS